MTNKNHNQEGSLLLMSILIMAGVVSAATSYGVITISHLKAATVSDNSARAYYAAESGIEAALYDVRKNERTVASLNALPLKNGTLTNGSTWSRTIAADTSFRTASIDQNDFWSIDVYNPDASLSSTSIRSLQIEWAGEGSWLEVEIASWSTAGILRTPVTRVYSVSESPKLVPLDSDPAALYRVRLKALYADIASVTVTGKDVAGTSVNLPAYLTIYSTGTYGLSNQVVRAQMPHRAALSGNFGYVLFSEESIVK